MAILVLDPDYEAEVRKIWPGLDDDRWTEVWDGVTVMSPVANTEHQNLVNSFGGVFWLVVTQSSLGTVYQAVNLSDRTPNWLENYRNPDAVVFLNGTAAVNHETHWVGGPDLAVEVISPGETPSAKFGFYESIGTRELLIVNRKPWRLELFALADGKLQLVGSSPGVCTSAALGLTFQLVDATPRPRIAVTHPATGGAWSV